MVKSIYICVPDCVLVVVYVMSYVNKQRFTYGSRYFFSNFHKVNTNTYRRNIRLQFKRQPRNDVSHRYADVI